MEGPDSLMQAEQPLAGGMDERYAPVRVGDTVRRAPGTARAVVRDLLLHLEAVGFDGAPRYLGVDDRDREILSWIEGDVPLPPYPAWSTTDRALADLGALVRQLHEATASFRSEHADWADDWGDPRPGGLVICHNDLFPENVVFRDGRVVALIDFAMASPGRPLWDLAIAAELWGPLGDPAWRDRHPTDLDGIHRLGVLARGYGLEPERAAELVDVLIEERAHSAANIRAEIADGNPSWIRDWAALGGDDRAVADDAWIERHRDALIAAARLTRRSGDADLRHLGAAAADRHHPDMHGTGVRRPVPHAVARVAHVVKRLIGIAAWVVGAVILCLIPMVMVLGRAFGAGGDDYQRTLIALAVGVVVLFAIAIVAMSDWSLSAIIRARATWAVVAVVAGALAWAAVGIDSTRAVRTIAEAEFTIPGATEVWSGAKPADGGLNSPARATLSRSFESDLVYSEVERQYGVSLSGDGWTRSSSFTSGPGRFINWERDGYTLQLRIPAGYPEGSGPFSVVIYGPLQ
jgi:hypothetical protein